MLVNYTCKSFIKLTSMFRLATPAGKDGSIQSTQDLLLCSCKENFVLVIRQIINIILNKSV